MNRVAIIGGGVIGLSVAYELARRGDQVLLIELNKTGRKASWAGAGILPAANPLTAVHPLEHLEAFSHEIHKTWSREFRDSLGIDNGFRQCGGLYFARTTGEVAALQGATLDWNSRGIEFEELEKTDIQQRLGIQNEIAKAILVPSESQISSPHHLRALRQAAINLGAEILEGSHDSRFSQLDGYVQARVGRDRRLGPDWQFVFACGPWTSQVTTGLDIVLPMQPVRGQIVLYKLDPNLHSQLVRGPIMNEGSKYLVPRIDGHVLAGSTIEEVGFDESTSEGGIASIRTWAESLVPELQPSTFVKAWAGLRPATYDGFPYIGRLGNFDNAFVATGHFKSGLHLSTGTAAVLADLVQNRQPTICLEPFAPQRISEFDMQ